jgi:acyl carrier protein
MDDRLETIEHIVRDLFDEYRGPVTRALDASQVAQWDSLSNIQFVVLTEQAFGIRFTSAEVRSFRNLGELLDAVERKQQARP